jgi:hypothetical protein
MSIFFEKINLKIKKMKDIIKISNKIDFIHLIDYEENIYFRKNPFFKKSKLFIPSDKMIDDFITLVKKINPVLDFKLHLLVHPDYVKDYENSIDQTDESINKNNSYIKIHLINKIKQTFDSEWNWSEVLNNIETINLDNSKSNLNNKIINKDNTIISLEKKLDKDNEIILKQNNNNNYNNNNNLPFDFDANIYKSLYEDLKNLTNSQLEEHYITHGKTENRIYKVDNDFNITIYKNIYKDISKLTDEEAFFHYVNSGIKEGRSYKYEEVFIPKTYKSFNKDLEHMTDYEATEHFYKFGIDENRRII